MKISLSILVILVSISMSMSRRQLRTHSRVPKVLSGDVCDMEVREYSQLKQCGCKFHGRDCAQYKAYIHEEPADAKASWVAAPFKAIDSDLTKKEQIA